jgi:3-oxoacid CoA-transferase
LTGVECVDIVVTDLAVLRRQDGHFYIEEVASGFGVDEVAGLTEMELRA